MGPELGGEEAFTPSSIQRILMQLRSKNNLTTASNPYSMYDGGADMISILLNNDDETPSAPMDSTYARYMFDLFKLVYCGIIVLVGLLGNAVCLIQCAIWSILRHKESSSAHYVLAICIADMAALMLVGKDWVLHLYRRLPPSDAICKVTSFLGFLGPFICPWFILAMTVERFWVVKMPLKRNVIVSVTKARCIILSIFTVGLAYNLWILVHYRVEIPQPVRPNGTELWFCTIDLDAYRAKRLIDILTLIVVFAVPCASICLFNAMIIYVLVTQHSNRSSQFSGTSYMESHAQRKLRLIDLKVARKLIFVSALFLLFNCPAYVWKLSKVLTKIRDFYKRRMITESFELLMVTQYAVHCFSYTTVIPKLRKHLKTTGRRTETTAGSSGLSEAVHRAQQRKRRHRRRHQRGGGTGCPCGHRACDASCPWLQQRALHNPSNNCHHLSVITPATSTSIEQQMQGQGTTVTASLTPPTASRSSAREIRNHKTRVTATGSNPAADRLTLSQHGIKIIIPPPHRHSAHLKSLISADPAEAFL